MKFYAVNAGLTITDTAMNSVTDLEIREIGFMVNYPCFARLPLSMFERYTFDSRRVVFFARSQAVHRGLSAISPEDLLLGLTWDEDTRADRIARLKDNAVPLRAALGIPHLPLTAIPYRETKFLPLTNESKRVLGFASFEADDDKEFQIDTDHLLRALLRERTPASEALEKLGASLTTLRAASREDRRHQPKEKAPWYWKPPFLFKPGEWVTVGLLLVLILLIAGGVLRSLLRTGFMRP